MKYLLRNELDLHREGLHAFKETFIITRMQDHETNKHNGNVFLTPKRKTTVINSILKTIPPTFPK